MAFTKPGTGSALQPARRSQDTINKHIMRFHGQFTGDLFIEGDPAGGTPHITQKPVIIAGTPAQTTAP
jgi:hypothetical protein